MPNGWNFPKIFDGNGVSILSGVDDVVKDLKLLFNSEVLEYRFDPGYGSNVELIRLRPKSRLTLDLLVDAIVEAQMFIPNLVFNRDSVNVGYGKAGEVQIQIRAIIDNNSYVSEIQLIQGGLNADGK